MMMTIVVGRIGCVWLSGGRGGRASGHYDGLKKDWEVVWIIFIFILFVDIIILLFQIVFLVDYKWT